MTSRRELVRTLTGLALGGGGVLLGACERARPGGGGAPGEGRGAADGAPLRLTRPILRPWAGDMVWIDRPADDLPVAYVSMARRQVFVDRAYRDRASWLLGAHISVSTALWRIPLPGDPEGEPISPGDERREFEEKGIQDWDPALVPSMDDVRIRLGVPELVQVELECAPLVGPASGRGASAEPERAPAGSERLATEPRLSATPWTMEMAGAVPGEPVREDFMVIGHGTRHRDRACTDAGDAVQYVGWAIRD